jgi:hypothetical protein
MSDHNVRFDIPKAHASQFILKFTFKFKFRGKEMYYDLHKYHMTHIISVGTFQKAREIPNFKFKTSNIAQNPNHGE